MKNNHHFRLLAFISAIIPISLLLFATGSAQLVQKSNTMPEILKIASQISSWYVPFILIPGLALLIYLLVRTKKQEPQLFLLMTSGLVGGFVATFVLDTFRQLGVIHKWLPTDTVMLFGKMISGPMSAELMWVTTGILYHFLNGATFGLLYVLIFGAKNWKWGVAWGLIVEFFMMTLPPMAPMTGFFGVKTGSPALFLITLIAHIGFGLTLGIVAKQLFVKNTHEK